MKFLLLLSFLFLTDCSYLGLSKDINAVGNDVKIEAQRREERELHPFPIIQGLTTESSTEIKLLSKSAEDLTFKVFHNEQEIKTFKTDKTKAGQTNFSVHRLVLSDLKLNTNYTLQVLNGAKILDQRTFQTVDLSMKNPKIGIVSCMNDKYQDVQFTMWNDYLKNAPTYTFMIGDNVYADTLAQAIGKSFVFKFATEDVLWNRYVQTFNTVSYYRAPRLTPTLAIWDDHDYGFNNGDETYPYKKESLKVFETFYGLNDKVQASKVKTPVLEKIGGAGYIFKAFGQSFVFMDNRTFRSEPSKLGKDTETHLGTGQVFRIMNSLKDNNPAWFIKGDQFFGAYHKFESYEANHPNDFKRFLQQLKDKKNRVFFVSGDRHLNELMKIENEATGYETFELTSSAIHASIYPNAWKKNPNPRQIHGASGVHNYSMVELKSLKPWTMAVTSYGPKLKVLYQDDLQIDLKAKSENNIEAK